MTVPPQPIAGRVPQKKRPCPRQGPSRKSNRCSTDGSGCPSNRGGCHLSPILGFKRYDKIRTNSIISVPRPQQCPGCGRRSTGWRGLRSRASTAPNPRNHPSPPPISQPGFFPASSTPFPYLPPSVCKCFIGGGGSYPSWSSHQICFGPPQVTRGVTAPGPHCAQVQICFTPGIPRN